MLEIKYHNPKKKNALQPETYIKLAELFEQANKDDKIKVVVLHGGEFYSAGNDLSGFLKFANSDPSEIRKNASAGV